MTTFVTRDTTGSAVKINVLLGAGGEACFRMESLKTCLWPTCCLKA